MSTRYRALLRTTLIVPEIGNGAKPTMAEEGSIVKLMDMRVMFRDRISPITRRPDEILVGWGKKGKEQLGWLPANAVHWMKEVEGPLFLVTTRDKKRLQPWDRIRQAIARADHRQVNKHRWWLVPWCVTFGKDYLPEIKKTIREFGGKPKPHDDVDAQCAHLVRIILKQELDMASAKKDAKSTKSTKKSSKKGKKSEKKAAAETKTKAKASSTKFDPRTRDFDDYLIRRLVKENPRKAGSKKAKVWDKLRKGMSVVEFVERGGSRGAVAKYLASGWIKLVRPKADE